MAEGQTKTVIYLALIMCWSAQDRPYGMSGNIVMNIALSKKNTSCL